MAVDARAALDARRARAVQGTLTLAGVSPEIPVAASRCPACWRNKMALLVYGVAVTLAMTAASAIVVVVFGAIFTSREALSLVLAPLALVLMTLVQASFYPMYKSVFGEAEPGR